MPCSSRVGGLQIAFKKSLPLLFGTLERGALEGNVTQKVQKAAQISA